MKRTRSIRATLGIVIIMAVGCLVPAVPQQTPNKSLAEQVTIRRDTYGVPHIVAPTEEAAAFGHGYACAEDHILGLARALLHARSEEAAHFGEKYANADFAVKQLHMYEGAEAGYAKMSPWFQCILDGYAAGYNHYLQQHRADLPEWVKPASGIDFLALTRVITVMEFTMNLQQIQRIGSRPRAAGINPAVQTTGLNPAAHASSELGSEFTQGSNMWAINKERSASGNAILLGNPHQPWGGARVYYEVHITVPGKINMRGASRIGTPIIAMGFNEHLGWSHTVNAHDTEDVYELTLDPSDQHRYIYDGRAIPMRKEELTIQVKTDAGLVPQKRELYWAHYGPVLKWHEGKAYALKSASLDEYRFLEQWNLMGKARNLAEFRRALDMQAIPMFNICYADREGNCFYLFNGRFPDRPAGYDWSGIVPGNTSATEWNSLLPQSRLPSLLNPPGGYVQNCNSAPWYTNLQRIIDRKQFPEDLTRNVNGLRQQLSLLMLEADKSISLEEVMKYKYNTKLLLADRVKPDLVKLARGATADGISLDEAANVLQAWDNTAARDSRGSVLFIHFWRKYSRAGNANALLRAGAQEPKSLYAVPWDEKKPVETPYGIGDVERAKTALAATIKEMKQQYGSISVPWGDVYRLRKGNVDIPIGGFDDSAGAFRIVQYQPAPEGKFVARGGDSFVFTVEFSSPPKAHSIVAYSQSGDPKSPHYTDQCELFANEKWKPAWFTEEEIAKNLKRKYRP